MSQLRYARPPRAVLHLPVRAPTAPRSIQEQILDTVSLAVRQASMAPSDRSALDIVGDALRRVAELLKPDTAPSLEQYLAVERAKIENFTMTGDRIEAAIAAADPARRRLVAWIDSHDRPQPTIDNGDGTLTVASEYVDAAGKVSIERAVIPATMSAARDLLGY